MQTSKRSFQGHIYENITHCELLNEVRLSKISKDNSFSQQLRHSNISNHIYVCVAQLCTLKKE